MRRRLVSSTAAIALAAVIMLGVPLGLVEAARVRSDSTARLERWKQRPYFVYGLSSVTGLPPFYLVSLAAGALRIKFTWFCVIGFAGRAVRFAVIVALPWL